MYRHISASPKKQAAAALIRISGVRRRPELRSRLLVLRLTTGTCANPARKSALRSRWM